MTDTSTLALTDDEAAAMALATDGAWRTPLPTVDVASEADLAAAILRGKRSLVVRDLARPDGTATGDAAEVLARLGTGPRAALTLVDRGGRWIPEGLTMYLYGPAPDQAEMSQVIAAAGVHYFRIAPPPGQWLALTELAEAVFESGFTVAEDGARQPVAAMLFVTGTAGIRHVMVARGEASAVDHSEPLAFTSAAEAIAWMLA
jgi:hypothetical protein